MSNKREKTHFPKVAQERGTSPGNSIYEVRSMESFDSKGAGISNLRTYVRSRTCIRRRVQMRYSGTRGASRPVTSTLLRSCILGNNVRRNGGHQRRSRALSIFHRSQNAFSRRSDYRYISKFRMRTSAPRRSAPAAPRSSFYSSLSLFVPLFFFSPIKSS